MVNTFNRIVIRVGMSSEAIEIVIFNKLVATQVEALVGVFSSSFRSLHRCLRSLSVAFLSLLVGVNSNGSLRISDL